MKIYDPRMDPALSWLKATAAARSDRLRAALRAGDRGASAIELAIITAVLVALAAVILGIIVTFTKNQGNSIQNQVVPSP
jgi:Flp pilus assembly protein TadG